MADRASALLGHYHPGKSGAPGIQGVPGVFLQEIHDLVLHQVSAWPDTVDEVGRTAVNAIGGKSVPGPCLAEEGPDAALLRIEPLKWWVVGAEAPGMVAEQGTTLDLSHSRTHIRITGEESVSLLNRHLPVDLRGKAFAVGSVASTVFHHVGVTVWHSSNGYELFLPRGFALSLWELLVETAQQFGLEVV
ncbi:MAG: sarcosine oxidase subunit gamma [Gammaproteobacteria bacterium]|nr:sarcosine oxidase subunit gamma [Gammaproteobacteria bacterium]